MKILLGSGTRNDLTISIALVQRELELQYKRFGHEAGSVFGDDFSIRIRRLTEMEFSLKCALRNSLFSSDVLDFKLGDGLFPAVRSTITKHRTPQLLVARSHGLDFIYYENKLKYAALNRDDISWREKLYVGRYLLWQVRSHMRLADVCLFLNHEEREYAAERLGIGLEKSLVIDNGIPDYMIGRPVRFQANTEQTGLRIAIVNRYVTRKINVLPQALNVLLGRHANICVGFLGSMVDDAEIHKDFSAAFRSRITNIKAYEHSQLPDLLAGYDIILFPSMSEGFGLVVFEAMACGLGVVAADLSSLTRRLREGHEAIFFRKLNPEAMVEAVERVMTEPGLLSKLQQAGYRRAQDFSWRRVAQETLDIYQEGLDRKLRASASQAS